MELIKFVSNTATSTFHQEHLLLLVRRHWAIEIGRLQHAAAPPEKSHPGDQRHQHRQFSTVGRPRRTDPRHSARLVQTTCTFSRRVEQDRHERLLRHWVKLQLSTSSKILSVTTVQTEPRGAGHFGEPEPAVAQIGPNRHFHCRRLATAGCANAARACRAGGSGQAD